MESATLEQRFADRGGDGGHRARTALRELRAVTSISPSPSAARTAPLQVCHSAQPKARKCLVTRTGAAQVRQEQRHGVDSSSLDAGHGQRRTRDVRLSHERDVRYESLMLWRISGGRQVLLHHRGQRSPLLAPTAESLPKRCPIRTPKRSQSTQGGGKGSAACTGLIEQRLEPCHLGSRSLTQKGKRHVEGVRRHEAAMHAGTNERRGLAKGFHHVCGQLRRNEQPHETKPGARKPLVPDRQEGLASVRASPYRAMLPRLPPPRRYPIPRTSARRACRPA